MFTSSEAQEVTLRRSASVSMGEEPAAPMSQNVLNNLKIAIASDSVKQRSMLRKVMDQAGLDVVLSEPLTRLFLRKLEKTEAEVLLLDLHDELEHDEALVNELLDGVAIPIIFNDVTALALNEPHVPAKWYFSLMSKIAALAGHDDWNADLMEPDPMPAQVNEEIVYYSENATVARNVWVLGASLGGPEAVKRFLMALPDDVPAAFVLAQHLGANFISLLAEQLNRSTDLEVLTPQEGHVFRHQQVLVSPVNRRIWINSIGAVELENIADETPYTPSINRIISDVAQRYGQHAGAIIFSGMGDDGALGCYEMNNLGGQVWTQSPETCVVSSMPDNVRQVCCASYTGTPEQLAHNLATYLQVRNKEVV